MHGSITRVSRKGGFGCILAEDVRAIHNRGFWWWDSQRQLSPG